MKKCGSIYLKEKDIVDLEEDEVPAEQEDLGIGKIK